MRAKRNHLKGNQRKVPNSNIFYRKRRDTLTHVDSVMETIQDQLNGLQVRILPFTILYY